MNLNSLFLKYSFFSILIILLIGCVNVLKLSDVNTSKLSDNYKKSEAMVLLTQMAEAHGSDKLKKLDTYTVSISDEYYGFIGQQNTPFKNDITSLSLSYIPFQKYGQIEITSGRERDVIWGMQDKIAYTIFNDELKPTVDLMVNYWVPNYQFIFEFPGRVKEFKSLTYVGKDTIKGEICEGVIACENSITPEKEGNQYLIWINSTTKRIAKLVYTKRRINNYAIETAYFNTYNNYEGILLPSEILVESNLVKKGLLHKISIFSLTRDYLHRSTLKPISSEIEEE